MVYLVVVQKLTFYTTCFRVGGVGDYCSLQKEVAILSSLVTCLLYKVIGWLGIMRCVFPHISALSLKGRPVSCVLAGIYPSLPILSVFFFYYGFGKLLIKSSNYGVVGVSLSGLITLLDEALGCFWQIVVCFQHTPSWDVMLGCTALSRHRRN